MSLGDESTDAEHQASAAAIRGALDTAVGDLAGYCEVGDLVSALEAPRALALSKALAYGVVVQVHTGRLRGAGSGRVGVWISSEAEWSEAIRPMILRLEGQLDHRTAPVSTSLGAPGRYWMETCDLPVQPGQLVLVGMDVSMRAGDLAPVDPGASLESVLATIVQGGVDPSGSLALIRV